MRSKLGIGDGDEELHEKGLHDEEEDDLANETIEIENSMELRERKPIFNTWAWNDPVREKESLSAVILLPSGAGDADSDVRVRIDDTCVLCVNLRWPPILNDPIEIHRKWIVGAGTPEIQEYHPRVLSYKQMLHKILSLSDGNRESIAGIQLPCRVHTPVIESEILAFKGTLERNLYVTMRVVEHDAQKLSNPVRVTVL